jgi:predicted Zn-dependent peptidase
MIKLDRTYQPELNLVDNLEIIQPSLLSLDNGIKLYSFDVSELDFVKIEFVFEAGSKYSNKQLLASFTNNMLLEGAEDMSSKDLAEAFDFLGANISANSSKDYAVISLTVLNQHLKAALDLLSKILFKPSFDENEFNTFIQNKIQAFLVNNQRVDYIAKNNFLSLIFGENHPYGKITDERAFSEINIDDLKSFYKNYFTKENCVIIASGNIKSESIQQINKVFGNNKWNSRDKIESLDFDKYASPQFKHLIEKKDAMQNAIRIGKEIINRNHKDYFDLSIANTVLGGYFGSRLMKNIREEKGYTYGIGSGIANMKDASVFFIVSEVGFENTENAVNEIHHEIEKLAKNGIDNEELVLVKNYLQGSILRKFDGPFAISERFKELYLNGLNYSYYTNYLERIKSIKGEDIQNAVKNHILNSNLYELIVGNKNNNNITTES